MAVSYDYCAPLADVEIEKLNVNAGKVCSAVTSDAVRTGTKDCGTYETPVLSWSGISAYSEELPGDVVFEIDLWGGVETNGSSKCVWVGSEAYKTCIQPTQCQIENGEVSIAALKDAVDSLVDSLQETDADLNRYIREFGKAVVLGVIVVAVAFILIEFFSVVVAGAVGASVIGGAAILS